MFEDGIKMKDIIYGLYVRVSTDEQNIEQQIQFIKEYTKRNNLKIRTYNDFDVSGKIPITERPAGKNLIRDMKNGIIQGLIVAKWDRITRVLKHSLEFLEFWEKYKFSWISIYDGTFTGTPDNIFTFKLKCLLSEYELQQLEWRRNIGIARAKKEPGKYLGRKKGSKNKIKGCT